jgi:hypothetical protein
MVEEYGRASHGTRLPIGSPLHPGVGALPDHRRCGGLARELEWAARRVERDQNAARRVTADAMKFYAMPGTVLNGADGAVRLRASDSCRGSGGGAVCQAKGEAPGAASFRGWSAGLCRSAGR